MFFYWRLPLLICWILKLLGAEKIFGYKNWVTFQTHFISLYLVFYIILSFFNAARIHKNKFTLRSVPNLHKLFVYPRKLKITIHFMLLTFDLALFWKQYLAWNIILFCNHSQIINFSFLFAFNYLLFIHVIYDIYMWYIMLKTV